MPRKSKLPDGMYLRGGVYYLRYNDGSGKRYPPTHKHPKGRPILAREKLSSQEPVAREMRLRLLAMAEKRKAGLLDGSEIHRAHNERLVSDHLDAWEAAQENKGVTAKHSRQFRRRAGAVIEKSGITGIATITAPAIDRGMAELRSEMSQQTVRHYWSALRAFCIWLSEAGRIAKNPLEGVKAPRVVTIVHLRRVFTEKEWERFLEGTVARNLGPKSPFNGPKRRMMYETAYETGFRLEECLALLPEWFHLDGDRPWVHLPPEITKDRKGASQPITTAFATKLGQYLKDRPAGAPVFDAPRWVNMADVFDADLRSAGISKWEGGKVLCFHSIRHKAITRWANNLPAVKAMKLARHKSLSTTLKYVHAEFDELSDDVNRIGGIK